MHRGKLILTAKMVFEDDPTWNTEASVSEDEMRALETLPKMVETVLGHIYSPKAVEVNLFGENSEDNV